MILVYTYLFLAFVIALVASLTNLMGITDAPWSMWLWWLIPWVGLMAIRVMRALARAIDRWTDF